MNKCKLMLSDGSIIKVNKGSKVYCRGIFFKAGLTLDEYKNLRREREDKVFKKMHKDLKKYKG